MLSYYLNQCWNIVNWTLRNKLQWNINQNSYIFIQGNASENVGKLADILSQSQCVKTTCASNGYSKAIEIPKGSPEYTADYPEFTAGKTPPPPPPPPPPCWDCVAVYQLVNICHISITLQPCGASAIYSWYLEYQLVTEINISSLHLEMWVMFSSQKTMYFWNSNCILHVFSCTNICCQMFSFFHCLAHWWQSDRDKMGIMQMTFSNKFSCKKTFKIWLMDCYKGEYIYGSMWRKSSSSVLTMQLRLFCIGPSI